MSNLLPEPWGDHVSEESLTPVEENLGGLEGLLLSTAWETARLWKETARLWEQNSDYWQTNADYWKLRCERAEALFGGPE